MIKERIKTEYNILVRQLNQKKYSKWYKLKDLVELKGISYKSLKNMVDKIYNKYEPQGTIKKEGRRYYIHYSIIDVFKLKQPRTTTIYSYNWEANISWTTKEFYDKSYHECLISELKKMTKGINYMHTIEFDKSNRLHVHLLADEKACILKPIIKQMLDSFLGNRHHQYRLYCEKINNKGCSVDYLIKNPQ